MKAAWIERKKDKKVRKIQKRDYMKKMIVKNDVKETKKQKK